MATPEKKNTQVVEKSVVDIVSEKVNEFLKSGQLDLPRDYSWDNATKSAYLALHAVENKNGEKVMVDGKLTGVCTKASIANAILDMVVQGLNPTKDQCYFIVFGKSLTCFRSYFGSMAVAQRVNTAIKDWGYEIEYEGDEIKYEIVNGKKGTLKHIQDPDNVDDTKIKGAYAMALDKDGVPIRCEYMTIKQIHQAWKQSPMKPFDGQGNLKSDSAHAKFPRDFALRTVINKLAKQLINSSSDNALLLERINRAEDLADAAAAQAEIEDKANRGSVVMIEDDPKENVQLPEKPAGINPRAQEEKANGVKEEAPQGRGPSF